MPDPLADPGAPWWERRRPPGWPDRGIADADRAIASDRSGREKPVASRVSPPMDQLSFIWTLTDSASGWAECAVSDQFVGVRMLASDVGPGPEYLLRAVAAILLGADGAEAELFAEPATCRWIIRRDGHSAEIRILKLPDWGLPDEAGAVIWASRQRLDVLSCAVTAGFDQLAAQVPENDYQRQWGHPFPRAEVETLRKASAEPAE